MSSTPAALQRFVIAENGVVAPAAARVARALDMVMNARVNPARDVLVIDDHFNPNDPSAVAGVTSKLVVDATQKGAYPDISLPPKEFLWRAWESWREAGLPAFERPARIERVLDYHAARMRRLVP